LVASTGTIAGFLAGFLGAVRPSLGTALPARGRRPAALLIPFALVGLAVRFLGIATLGGDTSIPPSTVVFPFTGYFDVWRSLNDSAAIVASIPLVAAVATMYIGLAKRTGWVRLSWITTGLLVLAFGSLILQEPNNWIRAAAALPVLWVWSRALDPRPAPDQEPASA
jgi:hypothetical protein